MKELVRDLEIALDELEVPIAERLPRAIRLPAQQLLAEVDELDLANRRDEAGSGTFEHRDALGLDQLAEHDVTGFHSPGCAALQDIPLLAREEIARIEAAARIAPQDLMKTEGRLETPLAGCPRPPLPGTR